MVESFARGFFEREADEVARDLLGARFVSTVGTLSDEFLISDPGASGLRRFPAVGFSPKSESFLVLWEDGRNRPEFTRQIFGNVRKQSRP